MTDSNEPGNIRHSLQSPLVVFIVTLVAGLLFSVFVSIAVKRWEDSRHHIGFSSKAQNLANAVENALNEYLGVLTVLGEIFSHIEDVDRRSFSEFSKGILERYPGIHALSWNPLVLDHERAAYEARAKSDGFPGFQFRERSSEGVLARAAQRKEYVVVFYIEPLEDNKSALGFDISSNPVRKKAIEKAFSGRMPVSTGRITLVQEKGSQFGILILFPIYRYDQANNGGVNYPKKRKGFVVEVLRLGDLLRSALSLYENDGFDLFLFDLSADPDQQLLAGLHDSEDSKSAPINSAKLKTGTHWSRIVVFAGRKWEILLVPSREYLDTRSYWQVQSAFLFCFFVTVFLAFYLYRKQQYAAAIEQGIIDHAETNRELQKEIRERYQAEEQIKANLQEKEVLLHEIHHRVKNNLQVVSSLLKLQADYFQDETIKTALEESQNRIYSMSAIHETLYQSERLSEINLRSYLKKITDNLYATFTSESNRHIELSVDAEEIEMHIEHASPLGLIVNELVTNSFKYAFENHTSGKIQVIGKAVAADELEITIRDNGKGLPADLDWKNTSSMGLKLVVLLAESQLDGSIEKSSGAGAAFTIRFKRSLSK